MRTFIVIALASLTVAACDGSEATGPGEPTEPGAASVRVRQLYDISGGVYVEGAYSYVRVDELDGDTVVEKKLDDPTQRDDRTFVSTAALSLDPGTYRLVSYQRPCEGNCGYLDPPTDRCAREIVVEAGTPLAVTINLRPGAGCTIETAR